MMAKVVGCQKARLVYVLFESYEFSPYILVKVLTVLLCVFIDFLQNHKHYNNSICTPNRPTYQ